MRILQGVMDSQQGKFSSKVAKHGLADGNHINQQVNLSARQTTYVQLKNKTSSPIYCGLGKEKYYIF